MYNSLLTRKKTVRNEKREGGAYYPALYEENRFINLTYTLCFSLESESKEYSIAPSPGGM